MFVIFVSGVGLWLFLKAILHSLDAIITLIGSLIQRILADAYRFVRQLGWCADET